MLRATNTREPASDRKSRFGLALLVAAVLCLWIAPGALAAPLPPSVDATNPASPSNVNNPLVIGSAEDGSTVTLYTGPACNVMVTTGAAAEFDSPGLAVPLGTIEDDSVTVFTATASDGIGGTSDCSAGLTYTEDSLPPETAIDSGPSGLTNDPTPTFTFWGSQSPSFECRVDAGPWFACTTPYTSFALADGPHRFQVRATDPAGNTDQSPATRDFTIDSDLPETTIDAGPAGLTTDASPRFEFSSNDPSSIFECRLDSGDWAACSSPKSYGLLLQGPHTFEVRATDNVGNADPMPAQRNFTVDTRINGSAGAKASQKQAGKGVVVRANASAGEELDVDVAGRIKLGKRSYKLKPKTRRLGPGRSTALTLRPKKPKHAKKIAKALKRGRKATAKLEVILTDEAGNTESRRLRVKLRR